MTLGLCASGSSAAPSVYRIDHVSDGDSVVLRNGQRVRLSAHGLIDVVPGVVEVSVVHDR